MNRSKICLCLTCSTLAENLAVLDKYRRWIDMAELRVDFLSPDERLHIRRFPEIAGIPIILTIRRTIDGGQYREGEAARTTLLARALAFADQDVRKNFAYIDLEEDFHVSSLQDAALAFGTRIIRSYHNMNDMVYDIPAKLASMRITGYEIPKIACMPHCLQDVTNMFREAASISYDHILCAMGSFGLPSRILSDKLGSFLMYCSPPNADFRMDKLGHLDPVQLNEVYHFRSIDDKTEIYGITGFPLTTTSSPQLHNKGYRQHGINGVYVPVKAETIGEALEFAETLGMKGLSITVPHKETVLKEIQSLSTQAGEIGACNTIVRTGNEWKAYNTDAAGFKRALLEFLGVKNLAHKKVAIIGAGGAARAVANVVSELRGRACIFNRSITKARSLASVYNFRYASLGLESHTLLENYSWLIIQTTPIGMGNPQQGTHNDPIEFYSFRGDEYVYDLIYSPEETPLLKRAKEAGCAVSNGYSMLEYQAYAQFELFTGVKYE